MNVHERIYEGKTLKIIMKPTRKEDEKTGIKITIDRQGWTTECIFEDSTLSSYLGLEMYYVCVKRLAIERDYPPMKNFRTDVIKPNSRPTSPTSPTDNKELNNYQYRFWDDSIIDGVTHSSSKTDIGSAEIRLDQAMFHLIQRFKTDRSTTNPMQSDGLWWEIKYHCALINICLWLGLLKTENVIKTFGELCGDWKTHIRTVSEFLIIYENNWSLNTLGRGVQEAVSTNSFLYYLCSESMSELWSRPNNNNVIRLLTTSTLEYPSGGDETIFSTGNTDRLIQIILVIAIFTVVITGSLTIVSENKRIVNTLREIKNSIQESCLIQNDN